MNDAPKLTTKLLALLVCLFGVQAGKADTIQVTSSISANETWYATNEYVLNGFIYVLDGGALTIEAGTVVKAMPGQDANTSCLIVTRGGKIFANGTRTKPIIFTAEADDVNDPDDLPIFQRGLWGGVVLMGAATLNTAVDTAGNAASPKYDVFEGLPDSQISGQFVHRFGGTNDNDSCGVMRYVSIRHAGVVFQPNRELNGLSLCAVGRGTVLENIESYAVADDGFEFFGGAVNTRYLVSAFNDDDCFDTDQGYHGKNQFWFAIQEPGRKDNGGELNGEPNGLAVSNAPIANYEIYNATWIGAGTNTTGNRGMIIREYAAPKIYNSVFTEFGGAGVNVDVRSAVHVTNGLCDLRDNLWWNFATNGVARPLAETAEADVFFSDTARNNQNVNPMLASISRTNLGGLDPRPLAGSPALTVTRTPPNDGFYLQVGYKGAFNENNLWLRDWTFLSQKGFLPPPTVNVVNITGPVTNATTWYATNEYVLNGFIYVLDGATLTIEPGTVVKAAPGQDANTSCLIVTRGGKIFANGTRTKPIIFTSESDDVNDPDDLPIFQRGLWGGIVLMGRAVLNTAVDTAGNTATPKYDVFEGLPDSQVGGQFVNRFGGNDDDDSSGVMRYVSIRHAGIVFQPNRELNGLSLGAVGRGTVLENIESYAVADDGFEFFGGTVNTRYLVSAFNDDDCFDTDQGYRGKNQFWFAIQEPGRKDNGGELNGEPNGLAVNASPIANFEVYNATWIGAGTNTTGNRGMIIREYAAPKMYNSIFTEFGGSAVNVDVRSAVHVTNGICDLRDNLFWNFATNGVPRPLAETAEAQVFFTDTTRSNENVNPTLRGISRSADGGLDPRPLPGSPALTTLRSTPNDGFYKTAPYKGAFDGNDLWIAGWTFLSQKGFVAPRGANTIQVTASISGNATWYRTNEYVLNGFIYVLNGGTLTIEAGTVVKARPGQDADTSCLIVTRGGKIFANGTAHNPIIFTAEQDDVNDPTDLPIFQRGLWGGIVLMGNASLNTAVDTAGNAATPKYDVFEGLPDTQLILNGQFVHRFGGNDDDDSSGVMRYVSIRHAGVVFQPNRELNGLSLAAVGRGTVLENIESYAIADDGFEFFGGTVNTRYLVSAFNDDDCFDTDQGYRGKNQFWFAIQEPGRKDNGGELNGEPNGLAVNASPIANFEVYNATWIGAGTNTTGNRGMIIREYAAPKFYNSVFTEFGGSAVNVDVRSAVHVTNGLCDLRDNLFWNFATNGVPRPLAETAAAEVFFTDTTRSNENVNPMLRGISRTPDFGLDPRPVPGSPALTTLRVAPNDGFYCNASYKGAFDSVNWATDWTALSELCILTGAGGGMPMCISSGGSPCSSVTLTIVRNGANVEISFTGVAGASYQVQSATDLSGNPINWMPDGSPLSGVGTLTYSTALSGDQKFYRVICQ